MSPLSVILLLWLLVVVAAAGTKLVCSAAIGMHPMLQLAPTYKHVTAAAGIKLVCSLGPSSHSVAVLEEMLRASMDAARMLSVVAVAGRQAGVHCCDW
jgi:hypothetical protein